MIILQEYEGLGNYRIWKYADANIISLVTFKLRRELKLNEKELAKLINVKKSEIINAELMITASEEYVKKLYVGLKEQKKNINENLYDELIKELTDNFCWLGRKN